MDWQGRMPPNMYGRGVLQRFYDWLDTRTGIRGVLREALDEPLPGGASWFYVFGSGLLFLFLSQFLTGIFLALNYSPTADYAHVSVDYIMKVVNAGSFLHSIHGYGASAVIIVLLMHLMQTFTFGAYKGRRELLWIAGCVLLLLMLGMALTGYLLPWDQKAYFASTVATNILSQVPVIGPGMRTLLRGGTEMGTLTVSRFFAIHVFFLPALIFAFVAIHVYLFRKAGAAGPIDADPITPRMAVENFYPRQVFIDLIFTFCVVLALGLLSLYRPYELGPVANPSDTTFLPRPEWYYRPIFEGLKYFPGQMEIVGAMVIPGTVIALLFAAPWLDRKIERRPAQRLPAIAAFYAILAGYAGLGFASYWQDSHSTGVAAQLERQQKAVEQFMRAPFKPVVIGTSATAVSADPLVEKGKAVYQTKGCNGCHGEAGTGSANAPPLAGLAAKTSPDKLAELIAHPTPEMMAAGMPAFDLPGNQMQLLLAYLASLK
jgi:quinol-cytochrome oxidoreductase complex cytochrome b subunit